MDRSKAWFAVFSIGLTLSLSACHRAPDDVALRRAVSASVEAAESLDASALSDQLTADFIGNDGQFDRSSLVNLLRTARMRHETLHVLMGPVTVEPRGERHVVSFTVTLTSRGGLLPSDLGMYSVETAWRPERGDWICYAAHWRRSI